VNAVFILSIREVQGIDTLKSVHSYSSFADNACLLLKASALSASCLQEVHKFLCKSAEAFLYLRESLQRFADNASAILKG
jgi:hypothetical protein